MHSWGGSCWQQYCDWRQNKAPMRINPASGVTDCFTTALQHFKDTSDSVRKVSEWRHFLPEASVALGTSWGSAVDWGCLPTSLQHPASETEECDPWLSFSIVQQNSNVTVLSCTLAGLAVRFFLAGLACGSVWLLADWPPSPLQAWKASTET